jgi:hypothetical protein
MNALTHTDKIDTAFPYVLVSSTLGTLFSLAAVWISTAFQFGSVIGA